MAIVVSTNNKFKGIITIEDILEEIVGELYDESDREEDGIFTIEEDHFIIN